VLPPDVARLQSFNAVPITPDYFKEAMERLRTRFLKTPSRPGLKLPSNLRASPSRETRSIVEPDPKALLEWATSAKAPVLPAPQLVGRVMNQDEIQLAWSEVPGADEYVLERAISSIKGDRTVSSIKESFLEVYRGPDRSYNDTLFFYVVWLYRVRASASGQAGKWSDVRQYKHLALRRRDP
jgi:hypothetical protein